MRTMRMVIVSVAAGIIVTCMFFPVSRVSALQATVQQQPTMGTPPVSSRLPDSNIKAEPENPMRERMEEQAAKARNSERFKRIQSDTDKLLKLSTELKDDVDKTTKNEMSLDVIKKAAEIEKLAHDVKERMKG